MRLNAPEPTRLQLLATLNRSTHNSLLDLDDLKTMGGYGVSWSPGPMNIIQYRMFNHAYNPRL